MRAIRAAIEQPCAQIVLDPAHAFGRRDAWGISVPHIDCRPRGEDHQVMKAQSEGFKQMIKAVDGEIDFVGSPLGLEEFGRGAYPDADPFSRALFRRSFHRSVLMGAAIHESGGARMGDDPKRSVLNKWNQCWDAPNLVVSDASAFCSSGVSGTTLTVMALTLRACRNLATALKGQDRPISAGDL
nr:GMC family oxidoreductase [Paracoccus litorisediminis]